MLLAKRPLTVYGASFVLPKEELLPAAYSELEELAVGLI
jgi:hypothetical protein